MKEKLTELFSVVYVHEYCEECSDCECSCYYRLVDSQGRIVKESLGIEELGHQLAAIHDMEKRMAGINGY